MAKTFRLTVIALAASAIAAIPALKKPITFSLAGAAWLGHRINDALFSYQVKTGLVRGLNAFSKEERVAFADQLLAFEDDLAFVDNVEVYKTSPQEMERSGNVIWVPEPYIATSYDGLDQSANFKDITQLSVPLSLGFSKSTPWSMSATDLNDALQNENFGEAGRQKLASDINVACANVASLFGALVVKRTAAASGYDDVAECDALMNEQGIQRRNRAMLLHTRNYNGMASNLAARGTMTGKPTDAYETNYVGKVAGFQTYEGGYTYSLAAATATGVVMNGANQRYVPVSTATGTTGTNNVDNRFQIIAITVGASTVKVGDAFTIAGVNAVHHITKQTTGRLKTFRITRIVTGAGGTGTVEITPPIIAADSAPTAAETQYKNVTATPANGAAITFLNTSTANVNPFWVKGALKLLPGKYSPQENAGLAVLRGTTKQGIELLMTKQAAIGDLSAKYRMDVRFGVTCAQPDMCGIELFSQP